MLHYQKINVNPQQNMILQIVLASFMEAYQQNFGCKGKALWN